MLLAFLLQAVVNPGEVRTFTDWTVGCDNGRACQAVALLPEPQLEGATLTVRRGAEAGAAPVIWVTVRDEGVPSPAFLAIDGRRFAMALDRMSQSLRVRDAIGAARLLGKATRIEALDGGGRRLASITTRGSAAALLRMDAEQRRVGTTSALVRRGAATRVPAPPALPLITSPARAPRPARNLARARVRQLLGPETVTCEYAQQGTIESVRLDARSSLVLASHPCGNGAYNFFSSAYIVDERGRATAARFDRGAGMGEGGDGPLVNADWNAGARRLTSYAKARGLGDCGSTKAYAWDGARFRVVEETFMGECRGSTDYITTFRARVVQR